MFKRLVISLLLFVPEVRPAEPPAGQVQDTEKTKGCGPCCETDYDKCPLKDEPPVKDRFTVCYFTNYAYSRPGQGGFWPANIDPKLCTHINYDTSKVDSNTLTLVAGNPAVDIDKGFYKEVTDLKTKGLKVMLIITVNRSVWKKTIKEENRPKFIKSVVDLIKEHNFDGVDMNFSTPACPLGNTKDGQQSHEDHIKLFQELRAAFNGKYFISVQLPNRKETIDNCFSMEQVIELADWVNLNTYQYHFWPEGKVLPQTPICGTEEVYGVYNTLKFYLDTYRFSPEKVTLGIPFYGSTYKLKVENAVPKFGDPSIGSGDLTPFMHSRGFGTYYEGCLNVKTNQWLIGNSKTDGDFIYKGNQFMSTPSIADMKRKVCLAKMFKLKGINIWSLDYDDFNEMCGCGKYPLLKTVNKELLGKGQDISCIL